MAILILAAPGMSHRPLLYTPRQSWAAARDTPHASCLRASLASLHHSRHLGAGQGRGSPMYVPTNILSQCTLLCNCKQRL